MKTGQKIYHFIKEVCRRALGCLRTKVYFGKHLSRVPNRSLIFFPCLVNRLSCGLTGIVAYQNKTQKVTPVTVAFLREMLDKIEDYQFTNCLEKDVDFDECYLGGKALVDSMLQSVRLLKTGDLFYNLFTNQTTQSEINQLAERLSAVIDTETKLLKDISEYEVTTPHVAAAKLMLKKNYIINKGFIVKYIVSRGNEKISDRVMLPEDATSTDYDPDYYINNQLLSAVRPIIKVIGYDEIDILQDKKQITLDGYF